MSIESTNSLSENLVSNNKVEISSDSSYNEKDAKISNLSLNSGLSPNYSACK